MKKIYTKRDQEIIVDDKYYNELVKRSWSVDKKGYASNYVYVRSRKEARETGLPRQKSIKMHRLVYELENNTELETEQHIDHINRNPSDNRIENLRLSEIGTGVNQINVGLRTDNTTGYKGVIYRKKTNKFESKISYKGKRIWLGAFDKIKDAAKAYNEKALELFGDACYLNKI